MLISSRVRVEILFRYLYTSQEVLVLLYGTEIALNGSKAPDNQALMNFKTDQI